RPPLSPPFPYTTLFRSGDPAPGDRRRRPFGLSLLRPAPRLAVEPRTGARDAARPVRFVRSDRACSGGVFTFRVALGLAAAVKTRDRKSTRLNSSHDQIS